MREWISATASILVLVGACEADDERVQAEAAELSAQSAAGSSSGADGDEGDTGPDGGVLRRRAGTTRWDLPQDPCNKYWSFCGEDNTVRKSQFNTCLAGFCLS